MGVAEGFPLIYLEGVVLAPWRLRAFLFLPHARYAVVEAQRRLIEACVSVGERHYGSGGGKGAVPVSVGFLGANGVKRGVTVSRGSLTPFVADARAEKRRKVYAAATKSEGERERGLAYTTAKLTVPVT